MINLNDQSTRCAVADLMPDLVDRERRKQKFVEMEQAIDALAAQTKDMTSLQNQHHMLQVLHLLCTSTPYSHYSYTDLLLRTV